MRPGQISIVKQNKIPCIIDNECHFALRPDKLLLETKPYGHWGYTLYFISIRKSKGMDI